MIRVITIWSSMAAPCTEISSGSHHTFAKKMPTVTVPTAAKNNAKSSAIIASLSFPQRHQPEQTGQIQHRPEQQSLRLPPRLLRRHAHGENRSEERRVGKEWRSRRSP